MPYLASKRKAEIDEQGEKAKLVTAGDLTYVFTKIMLDEEGKCHKGSFIQAVNQFIGKRVPRYEDFAIIMGSLTNCIIEFERRKADTWTDVDVDKLGVASVFGNWYYTETIAPYEDKKIAENGDVYQ